MDKKKNGFADMRVSVRMLWYASGRILLFLLAADALMDYVLSAIGGKLWGAVMKTVPGKYIGTSNVTEFLKRPWVLLTLLLLAAVYLLWVYLKIAGLIVILDCNRKGETIGLFEFLRILAGRVAHILQPRNLSMLLVVGVIVPLIDIFETHGVMAGFALPEYIMDTVSETPLLLIGYLLIGLLLLWFAVRYMMAVYSFVLEDKSTAEAMRESKELMRGRFFKTFGKNAGWKLVLRIFASLIPWVIVVLAVRGMGLWLGSYSDYTAISDSALGGMLYFALIELSNVYITSGTVAYPLVLFLRYRDCTETVPESADVKKRKKGFLFVPACYGVVTLFFLLLTLILTPLVEQYPALAEYLLTDTEIVAHRGVTSEAPENTIPAFEAAMKTGVIDYIELDVHPTKEGIPVVIHDENAKRTTGVDRIISEMTLDEVRELNAGYAFGGEFDGTPVPTLEEVIQLFGDRIGLLIEIKNTEDNPEFEKNVVSLMEQYGITERSMIHSLSYESLCRVKECNPNIRCGYVLGIGLGYFYDLENADFFSIEHTFINANVLKESHERGKKVYAWTMNDETFIGNMRWMDLDGMIGDSPMLINSVLHDDEKSVLEYLQPFVTGKTFTDAAELTPETES